MHTHTITRTDGSIVEFHVRKLKSSRPRVDQAGDPVIGRDGSPVGERGERWEARCLTAGADGETPLLKRFVGTSADHVQGHADAAVAKLDADLAEAEAPAPPN